MGAIMCNILYFTLFHIILPIQSLEELPQVAEDNDIATTEASLRNTVNKLFISLKLKSPKKRPRIRQFSTIHNFFTSISLGDQDNLKRIARLAKVDKIDNNTQYFITQLNEVLDDDHNKNTFEITDDTAVETYIKTFMQKLVELKEAYSLSSSTADINTDVLMQLRSAGNQLHNSTVADDGNVLSENEFWEPSLDLDGRRIFKGKATKIHHFPFMAVVQFFRKFQCAGSIIKSDLVITAASCLQLAWNNAYFRENPAFLSIRIGSNYPSFQGETIPILEILFHPSYNPKTLRDNLAILRLRKVINFKKAGKKVKKINFDKNPWPLPLTTPGVTVIGWGAKGITNSVARIMTNSLSYDVLDVYSWKECQAVYNTEYVTVKNFCAGYLSKGGGACNHDVGGPGLVGNTLVGVVSFGSPICGAPDAPTVFTKLGYYTDWIEEIVEKKVSNAVRRTTTLRPSSTQYYTDRWREYTRVVPVKSIDVIENSLRTLAKDDKISLFNKFLATMFGSQEMDRFMDEVYDTNSVLRKPEKKEKILKLLTEITQLVPPHRPYRDEYSSNKTLSTKIAEFDFSPLLTSDDSLEFFEKPTEIPLKTGSEDQSLEAEGLKAISEEDKRLTDYESNIFDESGKEMEIPIDLANFMTGNINLEESRNTYETKEIELEPVTNSDITDKQFEHTFDDNYVKDVISQNPYLINREKEDFLRTDKPSHDNVREERIETDRKDETLLSTREIVEEMLIKNKKPKKINFLSSVEEPQDKASEESGGLSIQVPEKTPIKREREEGTDNNPHLSSRELIGSGLSILISDSGLL